MKIRQTHNALSGSRWTASLVLVLAFVSLNVTAQYNSSPIEQLDNFYNATSDDPTMSIKLMTEEAKVTTITYDDSGRSEINVLSRSAYLDELQKLHADYWVKQEPLVVLKRGYGGLHTTYSSVYTLLADSSTGDTLLIKSIQTAHLVFDKYWKISHLTIQNENPAAPISDDLWPRELTKNLKPKRNNSGLPGTDYDPDKVYTTSEVDLAPSYPGRDEVYQSLLKTFEVQDKETEAYTPFTIHINEDGLAELAYVNDLSEKQIDQAKSFVASMLIWYPAVKDEASVKCKLNFYMK